MKKSLVFCSALTLFSCYVEGMSLFSMFRMAQDAASDRERVKVEDIQTDLYDFARTNKDWSPEHIREGIANVYKSKNVGFLVYSKSLK